MTLPNQNESHTKGLFASKSTFRSITTQPVAACRADWMTRKNFQKGVRLQCGLGELAVKLQSGVQTDINYAYDLDFFSGYVNPNSIRQRSYGYCVRLVTESK